ncbi:MAG: dynamin-like GTPase family protein [Gammaproteobacteria bacterium]|nr:MAG: dynamin-like GTPase family protein [Gammaproteobacteria bacterium]
MPTTEPLRPVSLREPSDTINSTPAPENTVKSAQPKRVQNNTLISAKSTAINSVTNNADVDKPSTDTPVSIINALSTQLDDYNIWREGLLQAMSDYQHFVEKHQHSSEGIKDLPIYELIESLKSDKLTIAIVGEFSRGKTELINAIFFADHKERLLPTDAGRTTMCPTELLYNPKMQPCIMLLPIETRSETTTIADYKRAPAQWTKLPLELHSPENMAETFQEIVRHRRVSVQDASKLGLYSPSDKGGYGPVARNGMVEVPVWRHAIINYPHPLLKKGLVILDTPGLNSLGSEPELTLSMLPEAHAVLFVLSADTGVTKSDLQIWNDYVRPATEGSEGRRIAVLNKVDTLWDELRGDDVVEASISRQMQETAYALNITKNDIFPVSALKGLIGKIQGKNDLLEKSGLTALEIKLSKEVIPYKQALIHDKMVNSIGNMVENTDALVEKRLKDVTVELTELSSLRGKNQGVIQEIIERVRKEQKAYDVKLENFNLAKARLSEQAHILQTHLSLKAFDKLIARTRRDMRESWTTKGLKIGMKTFFDGAVETMQEVNKSAHILKDMVESVYAQFQVEYGLAKIKSSSFSLRPYLNELARLHREAEAFRNSAYMVITEQHFVIKRFFITMVSHARNVFSQCNDDVRVWGKAIMVPVVIQIQEHKAAIDRRAENLKKISEQQSSLAERIKELKTLKKEYQNQLKTTQYIRSRINQHMFFNDTRNASPPDSSSM